MPSQVDICNMALISIGGTPITSITDNNKSARALLAAWDMCRQALLRLHPWNFAKKQVELAELDDDDVPLFGYDNAFALPTDCLRVLKIDQEQSSHKIYNQDGVKALFTDDSTVKLEYVADITDPNMFDSAFVMALSMFLAATVAPSVTENERYIARAQSNFETWKRQSKQLDALEETADQFTAGTWDDSRY